MAEKSKAAVLLGKEKIDIQEFPIPDINQDEGILQVEASGICGFDGEAYKFGGNGLFQLPCIMGHEVVGKIDTIGESAAQHWNVKEGDRVVIEEYIPCGTCQFCLKGHYQICAKERYGAMSIHHPKTALWGGYSEYMYLHPRSILHKVSPNVSPDLLPLFIPVSNGIHWVQDVGETKIGDTVVIQGPGPMGLGCVVGAKEAGAQTIIVTGLSRDERRLNIARKLGADYVLCIDQVDMIEEIKEITNGQMADTVINAATSPQSLAVSMDLAGYFGRIVHAGSDHRLTDQLNSRQITVKLLNVKGVLGRPERAVEIALRLIEQGKYPLEEMLSHKFSVEETDEAVSVAAFGKDDAVHVAVVNE